MVEVSTRRLPLTSMELAPCAAATPDDATPPIPAPTRAHPATTQQRPNHRKIRTPSPMRNAPLFTRVATPAPVAESTDRWACFGSFVQRFIGTANETPDPISLSPQNVALRPRSKR